MVIMPRSSWWDVRCGVVVGIWGGMEELTKKRMIHVSMILRLEGRRENQDMRGGGYRTKYLYSDAGGCKGSVAEVIAWLFLGRSGGFVVNLRRSRGLIMMVNQQLASKMLCT